jgi:hypothetical protein
MCFSMRRVGVGHEIDFSARQRKAKSDKCGEIPMDSRSSSRGSAHRLLPCLGGAAAERSARAEFPNLAAAARVYSPRCESVCFARSLSAKQETCNYCDCRDLSHLDLLLRLEQLIPVLPRIARAGVLSYWGFVRSVTTAPRPPPVMRARCPSSVCMRLTVSRVSVSVVSRDRLNHFAP